MKSFAVLALFASLAAQGYALMINTPSSLVQCQPALLTYGEGQAPYFVTVIPGGQPSASPLKSFDSTDATQRTWEVDIAAGTSVTLAVRDSTGAQAFSDTVTISSSSDSSCVNDSVAASGSEASGGATATGAASESSPAETTGTSTNAGATRSASESTGSATGSTAAASGDASNGAMPGLSMNAAGIAGLLGFIGAALL